MGGRGPKEVSQVRVRSSKENVRSYKYSDWVRKRTKVETNEDSNDDTLLKCKRQMERCVGNC